MMNGTIKNRWLAVMMVMLVLFTAACNVKPEASIPITASETGKAQVNGVEIAYESFGATDHETILLIAGTGMQLIDWPSALIKELVNRGYRVVIFDNRDAGLSTKFSEAGYPNAEAISKALEQGKPAPLPYTLYDMADDAAGLLDALKIQKAHVAGVSMGGAIAQLVGINHPDRVLSLTLMMSDSGDPNLPVIAKPEAFEALPTPPADGDKAGFVDYQVKVNQVLSSPGYPTDEQTIRAQVQRGVDRAYDPAALARQQTVSFMGHIESSLYRLNHLKDIQAPTVIVHGTDDPIVAVQAADQIAGLIPGAEKIMVEGMGHDLPVQLVPTVADAITQAAQRATGSK